MRIFFFFRKGRLGSLPSGLRGQKGGREGGGFYLRFFTFLN